MNIITNYLNKYIKKLVKEAKSKISNKDIFRADIAYISYLNISSRPKKYDNFKLDSELSDKYCVIYINESKKLCIIGFRGTKITSKSDLKSDVSIFINKMRKNERFEKSEDKFLEIFKKYSKYQIEITGHSLGGSITLYLMDLHNKKIKLNTVFNPGISLITKKGKNIIKKYAKNKKNRFIIKLGDPISNSIILFNPVNQIYIKNINKNVIKNHSLDNFISNKIKKVVRFNH